MAVVYDVPDVNRYKKLLLISDNLCDQRLKVIRCIVNIVEGEETEFTVEKIHSIENLLQAHYELSFERYNRLSQE